MSENIYPNSWYIMRHSHCCGWLPLLDSVGNRSYATGYYNALTSFIPRPAYRLINNKGKIAEECPGCKGVNPN